MHWTKNPANAAKVAKWKANVSQGNRGVKKRAAITKTKGAGKTKRKYTKHAAPVVGAATLTENVTNGKLGEVGTYAVGYLTAWLEGLARREGLPAGVLTEVVGRTLSRAARR